MTGKSKVLAYRLDEETQRLLKDAVQATDIEQFKRLLVNVEANYKTVNLVKKIVQEIDRYEQVDWGKELCQSEQPIQKVIGAYLIDKNEVYKQDPDYIIDLIKQYCKDDDWNVRQSSVDLMERMVAETEDNQLDFIQSMVDSEEPEFRRLALLTSKEIAKSAKYDDELKRKLLHVIDDLLAEEDPYVETVSSETFNEGYMKYCTEMTLDWLEEKLEETDNPVIKSTALTIIGSRYVDDHIDKALDIIESLLPEDDEQIKKARSSALHKLAEGHHDRVSSFLEDRLHIKQAVDHWAELEADGSLNSFTI